MANRKALPRAWQRLNERQRTSARADAQKHARGRLPPVLDPTQSAEVAGLRYVDEATTPGIRRLGRTPRFRYVDPEGRTVSDRAIVDRIRSLAIPPAWRRVWICPNALGHVQATGRDARGRKQYRYHSRWRGIRDEVKYGRLPAFARALPLLRRRAALDLAKRGLPREKVLAAVVQLLEKTLIRVGNEEYARTNHSFGLTTMRDQHATIAGACLTFQFRGKSGVRHAVDLHDARLARIVKACQDLPGHELFQYVDPDGNPQVVDSADLNGYLRETLGEAFTAKDFRTWAGTVLAARALAETKPPSSTAAAKRNIVSAVARVAKQLGNTKAVCRQCYIHPAILDAYLKGATLTTSGGRGARVKTASRFALGTDESGVVWLIERWLPKTA